MTAAPAATKRIIVPNTLTNSAITVDPGLEKFLPALPEEDYNALKTDIAANGVRDCLLVWRTADAEGNERRILIDGHNRYRACKDLGNDPDQLPAVEMEFEDRAAVESWMIANQLMRRNLTDERRAYFRGLAHEAAKKSQGGQGVNQHTKEQRGQNEPVAKRTAERLAEQFNVSASTIKRDAAFAKAVDALPSDEQRERVLSGKEKLPKAVRPEKPTQKAETDAEAKEAVSDRTPSTSEAKAVEPITEIVPPCDPVLTPDSINSITLSRPHEIGLLFFRGMNKATEYIESLDSVSLAEQESLLRGMASLESMLSDLKRRIQEMTTRAPEDASKNNAVAAAS